ncbi:MAG: hypothetical protein K2X38_25490 [Gemmataceae bacterium]|nr:hypothetical protein [Gemmataceae bacterium]
MSDDDLTAVREDGTTFTPIHFVDHETRRIVCTPNLIEMHAANGRSVPYPRTQDVQAVSCPRCMATEDYKAAAKEYRKATRGKR